MEQQIVCIGNYQGSGHVVLWRREMSVRRRAIERILEMKAIEVMRRDDVIRAVERKGPSRIPLVRAK